MATTLRKRRHEAFEIHEDEPQAPSAADTEMQEDEDEQAEQEEEEPEASSQSSEDDSDDEALVDDVQEDMLKIEKHFRGFKSKFRLIKRIGEGTFSTVYKAEDLRYQEFDNPWDVDKENESQKWTPPPLKRYADRLNTTDSRPARERSTRPKYVAIKKIYVTSSPTRILNELQLLHDLAACPSVCPLITAFREEDQVLAVLPYFKHADFRHFYRNMSLPDISMYLRSLFTALEAVHGEGIIHRDIKPTNFLYDPDSRRGVLVDFGLAEREGTDTKPCLCHDDATSRRAKLRAHVAAAGINATTGPHAGYPKNDTRPSRRANRAGTRGFRAPEVLFKCTEQTTKIDIWSAGVILLTILSKRFPFFNSADDVEALIEIATIFGQRRMRAAGQLHGCMFETNIPTIGGQGFSLEKIVTWSTCRPESSGPLNDEEKLAVEFLEQCLELDPRRRISASEALEHDFLKLGLVKESIEDEDEMDILKV